MYLKCDISLGFYNGWRIRVDAVHPHLWRFIEMLKNQHAETETSQDAAVRGDPAPMRRLKWRRHGERLARLKDSFRRRQTTLTQYWIAVSNVMGVFAIPLPPVN